MPAKAGSMTARSCWLHRMVRTPVVRAAIAHGAGRLVCVGQHDARSKPDREASILAELVACIRRDEQKLLLSPKDCRKQLNEMARRSSGLQKRNNFGDVSLQILLGVLLDKLVELEPRFATDSLTANFATALQLVGKSVVKWRVDILVGPRANPSRRIACLLKFVPVEPEQCNVKIVRKRFAPRIRDGKQGVVNGTKPIAGVSESNNEPQSEVFGLRGGSGDGEKKSNLVEIQVAELLLPAAALGTLDAISGFKPEMAKLLQLIFMRLDGFSERFVFNAKEFRNLARIGAQVGALVMDVNEFFHLNHGDGVRRDRASFNRAARRSPNGGSELRPPAEKA